jgi:hypothetical protein
MARRKKPLCTWVELSTIEHLRDLSARSRVPMAQIIRDVLTRGLPEWAHEHGFGEHRWLGPDEPTGDDR